MPLIADLTDKTAVLGAIKEYDGVGRDAFLEKYGYGPAKTWYLLHAGQQYESKAIAGVAIRLQHGQPPDRLHGGMSGVVPCLRRLGFSVVALGITEDTVALPEELSGPFTEGDGVTVTVDRLERSASARRACLAQHGTNCCICDFDFGTAYGEEFSGFIHVHHLKPLGGATGARSVDPSTDLVPVCPNCHAAIHYHRGNRSIDEMRRIRQTSRLPANER